MDKSVHSPRDLAVAAAIDRVLNAERASEAAIAEAGTRAAERIEGARAFRRALLDRTQARITSLHANAAAALEDGEQQTHQRILQIRRQQSTIARPDCIDRAIADLAVRLTGGESKAIDDA